MQYMLKNGLELTVLTPTFGYDQKRLECSNESLIVCNIRTRYLIQMVFPCYRLVAKNKEVS
jgi:hypothetical protein